MRLRFWILCLVVAFALGMVVRGLSPSLRETESLRESNRRLEREVNALQERLRVTQARLSSRPQGMTAYASTVPATVEAETRTDRSRATLPAETPAVATRPSRRGGAPQGEPLDDLAAPTRVTRAKPVVAAPTVEAAADRFNRYLEELKAADGQVRWQRVREAAADLQAMGDAGVTALLRSLMNGATTDERRAAAQLLGELQASQAFPYLQNILENDPDVLMRRAAASAMRRLDGPDAAATMQAIMANPDEDRFVRLSAAVGLAQRGNAQGIVGLEQIFNEAAMDGRGRDMAFRALNSLNDPRLLPFMRDLVTSNAEPNYRLQAIRFVSAQRDGQALGSLQQVMLASNEQPSIRDAAAQAYATISGR
jgi:HEAT repeat protein